MASLLSSRSHLDFSAMKYTQPGWYWLKHVCAYLQRAFYSFWLFNLSIQEETLKIKTYARTLDLQHLSKSSFNIIVCNSAKSNPTLLDI